MRRTAPELLMLLVGRLIPPSRAGWARAMSAQAAHMPHKGALEIAAGCQWVAFQERARSLSPDLSWFAPSVTVGALLMLHAVMPGSGYAPLIWPLLGGAIAVLTCLGSSPRITFPSAVRRSLKAAGACGMMFLAGSALLLSLSQGWPEQSLLARLFIGALAAAGLSIMSGIAVAPLVCQVPAMVQKWRSGAGPMGGTTVLVGTLLSALYLAEAIFPTGMLLLAWPLLGGVLAAAGAHWTDPDACSKSSGAGAGAKAGALATLILVVAVTPLVSYVLSAADKRPELFGRTLTLETPAALFLMFAGYGLLGGAVAAIAGSARTSLKRAGRRLGHWK